MATELSEYELQRLEHIRRNHETLVRLGLVTADEKPAITMGDEKPKRPARAKLPSAPPTSLRRSSRLLHAAPEFGGELVDELADDHDIVDPKTRAKRKRTAPTGGDATGDGSTDDDDEELVRREINEATVSFLVSAREAMGRFLVSENGDAPVDADGWRDEAIRRWGELAGGGVKAVNRDWKDFVSSRLSKPPPPSPEPLLQEYYAADTWQLLCTCVLMSRVSSWKTKHRCISDFFTRYETPSAFLKHVVEGGETGELRGLIHSLGLFDDRLQPLCAVTRAFMLPEEEETDVFEIDLKERKIRGIGEFGYLNPPSP